MNVSFVKLYLFIVLPCLFALLSEGAGPRSGLRNRCPDKTNSQCWKKAAKGHNKKGRNKKKVVAIEEDAN